MKQYLIYFLFKILQPLRIFKFQGRSYKYFCHRYNFAWGNERTVEIPVIWEIVKKHQGKEILEVGNVLSHYFSVNHDILDKFEKGKGVINQDVVKFAPDKKYDLIVSISTLEHVGWDEKPRDPKKILKAIKNLKNCLAPRGKMMVTLPLGYNPEMDKLLKEEKMRFDKQYYLKRISRDNLWRQVSWKNIRGARYNDPFPGANGVVVGVLKSE